MALADVLFPGRWEPLVDNLLSYARQAPEGLLPVLKMVQSISNKYSIESRSDPLYEEIIVMCEKTHDFLLELTVTFLQRVK